MPAGGSKTDNLSRKKAERARPARGIRPKNRYSLRDSSNGFGPVLEFDFWPGNSHLTISAFPVLPVFISGHWTRY